MITLIIPGIRAYDQYCNNLYGIPIIPFTRRSPHSGKEI